MCKIIYFICDPVTVTKNCDLFKQKQKIKYQISLYKSINNVIYLLNKPSPKHTSNVNLTLNLCCFFVGFIFNNKLIFKSIDVHSFSMTKYLTLYKKGFLKFKSDLPGIKFSVDADIKGKILFK